MLKPAARSGSTHESTLPQCATPSAGKSRVRSMDNRTSVTPIERRTFQALTDGGGSMVDAQIPNRMSCPPSERDPFRSDGQKGNVSLRDDAKGPCRWLGREDSNLRMAAPKAAALPLGDSPSR